MKFIYNFQMN